MSKDGLARTIHADATRIQTAQKVTVRRNVKKIILEHKSSSPIAVVLKIALVYWIAKTQPAGLIVKQSIEKQASGTGLAKRKNVIATYGKIAAVRSV